MAFQDERREAISTTLKSVEEIGGTKGRWAVPALDRPQHFGGQSYVTLGLDQVADSKSKGRPPILLKCPAGARR